MENDVQILTERLDAATTLLERTLGWLDERQVSGEVARISATVEQTRREVELAEQLAAAQQEIANLRAAAATAQNPLAPVRRTVPTAAAEMLAKHGLGDGPVDVRTLDAALSGLSLEQRIAVKTQLQRAGAIA